MTSRLKHLLKVIRSSMAFYPTLIPFLMAVLAIVLLAIETPELTKKIDENLSVVVIDNTDTARSLLGVLIGGIISLTVFSFSMVMILLSQASNNHSPRLLPGLISDKRHQIVLGFYIGTILFNIICLINVIPGDNPYQIPSVTILIAVILGLICLAMFVFFIHSISQAIQIDNVLLRTFEETNESLDRLQQKIERNSPSKSPEQNLDKWHLIRSSTPGKLMTVAETELIALGRSHQTEIQLLLARGRTVFTDMPILATLHPLPAEAQQVALDYLHYGYQERVNDNFLYGVEQMTEIAVRAMSPGTNDPGTAISAINFLVPILQRRLQMPESLSLMDDSGQPRLHIHIVPFEDLIYFSISAIRTYAAHDPVLVIKMLDSIDYLLAQPMHQASYAQVLEAEKKALLVDAEKNISNSHDLEMIQRTLSDRSL